MDMADYLRQIVTVLAGDIGSRTYLDLDRLERTATTVSEQFASFGCRVTRQPFVFGGNTYHNIIAELTGASPETLLIIGAHYDSVSTTPGADDNASGVAGLLGLARTLAGVRMERTVRFVAFALEEWPVYRSSNMASYHYALSLKERNERVEGMICLEMIGYFCDREGCQHYPFPLMNRVFPKTGNFISMVGNVRSKSFTERFAKYFRQGTDLPVATLNAPAIVIGIDFSDHWSFGKFGYEAFMATDTAFYRNPHYHGPTDLPDTLDYTRMTKVIEGLATAIKAWGGSY
ncbi:MAG: M28 family peptidase [Nitrospirota bacterium]